MPPMELRAQFDRREVVRPGDEEWRASPMAGVERQMLDRIGEEVARATSIVRYAASARFSPHSHGGGEEFLVFEGSFHDDAGDYTEGAYVRNPIGISHVPWAGSDGAVLFVTLTRLVAPATRRIVLDTRSATWREGGPSGSLVLLLHEHGPEKVSLVRWLPSARFMRRIHVGGEELLVLEGSFEDEHGT